MTESFVMPVVSGQHATARVTRWLCEEGESIREGADLIVVTTSVIEMRLPSPLTGVVKEIVVNEGDEVNHGDLLALIDCD